MVKISYRERTQELPDTKLLEKLTRLTCLQSSSSEGELMHDSQMGE